MLFTNIAWKRKYEQRMGNTTTYRLRKFTTNQNS